LPGLNGGGAAAAVPPVENVVTCFFGTRCIIHLLYINGYFSGKI